MAMLYEEAGNMKGVIRPRILETEHAMETPLTDERNGRRRPVVVDGSEAAHGRHGCCGQQHERRERTDHQQPNWR